MSILDLKVYEIFKSRFSEEEAITIMEYFDIKAKAIVAEKTEGYQSLQNKDMESLQKVIHTVFASKADLADTKADIIKWMFIFWIGQVAVTFGLILIFLKK
jgi:hypothetical protein